jgi:tetratricopeptide (TPR) repeat protein
MSRRFLALAGAAAALIAAPTMAREKNEASVEEGSTRTLYLALIRQARIDGKPRAALAYLDDFDRRHAGDREAQVLRVNCLLDLGQIDAAEAALARVSGADRSGEALAVRGHVLAASARWSEAAAAYGEAQAASPADPFIGNALGYAQLRAGRGPEAIETLRRALDLAPDAAHGNALVRNNLALALTAGGHSAEAAAVLSQVRDSTERQRLHTRLTAEAARLTTSGGGPMPSSR